MLKIAVHRESRAGETRVALTPEAVKSLVAGGWEVVVEAGAGARSHFSDAAYTDAGATVAASVEGDVNLRVNPPTLEEVARLPEGSLHLSFLSPLLALDIVTALNERRVTALSFDLVPRISRAQSWTPCPRRPPSSGYRVGAGRGRAVRPSSSPCS